MQPKSHRLAIYFYYIEQDLYTRSGDESPGHFCLHRLCPWCAAIHFEPERLRQSDPEILDYVDSGAINAAMQKEIIKDSCFIKQFQRELELSKTPGVSSVPTFLNDEKILFSGYMHTEKLRAFFKNL